MTKDGTKQEKVVQILFDFFKEVGGEVAFDIYDKALEKSVTDIMATFGYETYKYK